MAGLWLDDGLTILQENQLAPSTSTAAPTAVALCSNNPTLTPDLSYSDFTFSSEVDPITSIDWSYVLSGTAHTSTATATLSWTIPDTAFGTTFYGVVFYDPTAATAFYVEYFPAPYVVPSAGGSLTWVQSLKFGDCSYA